MSVTKTLALVAAVLVATQAHAAPAKKAAVKKAVVKQVAKTPADSAEGIEPVAATPATSQQSSESLMSTNVPPSTETSTADLAKSIKEGTPRHVFGEFYTETSEDMTDVKKGQGTPAFASFAGVKYDFGNARSISVRQNFTYQSAGGAGTDTRSSGDVHVDDIALNYTDGKLATILGDGQIILIGRLYAPTGESSRFLTHNQGQARLYLIETKTVGKWDLSLLQHLRAYNTTQDTYFKNGTETQNTSTIASLEADAFYNLNSVVSLGMIAGGDAIGKKPMADADTLATDFYIQPTLQLVPAKGVTAQVYIYNELNTRAPSHDQALLREEETQLWANLALTL